MIDGQDITNIITRKSMYDNDCVMVFIGDKKYLLPTSTIIQMVNNYEFKTTKKTKHTYLTDAIPNED